MASVLESAVFDRRNRFEYISFIIDKITGWNYCQVANMKVI